MAHKAYDVLPDRTKETLDNFLKSKKNTAYIREVCIDMWKPFKSVVEENCPNAIIVIDKFHVIRTVVNAVNNLRKKLQEAQTSTKLKEKLRYLSHILFRQYKKLSKSKKAKVRYILSLFSQLEQAYTLKEEFIKIYDAENYQRALDLLNIWYSNCQRANIDELLDAMDTIKRWQTEILNYFKSEIKITNAYTEGNNNKIKLIKRQAFGRLSYWNLRSRILSVSS